MGGRFVLLVIDGLGVGAMPDADESDRSSHTLMHVNDSVGGLNVPNLRSLGLFAVAGTGEAPGAPPLAAHGRSKLAHPGADSFLGHQELMGAAIEHVRIGLLSEFRTIVLARLHQLGHRTEDLSTESPILVDGWAVVADNIETIRGMSVNVTGSMDEGSFRDLTAIAEAVRAAVPVPRVIAVAGSGISVHDVIGHIKERSPGQVGVDSPALGVYGDSYQVRHLGANFDRQRQLPARLKAAGHYVGLIGKAADIIECDGADKNPLVPTGAVLDCAADWARRMPSGLLVVNVQETDLAGHEEDPIRYARLLELVDSRIPHLTASFHQGDMLFVTGDHGNDPCIGHSRHTREMTPLLVTGPDVVASSLGVRSTLADIGATIGDLLHVRAGDVGTSFARALISCS